MKRIRPTIRKESRNPWAWVPSLYFAEGVPYVVVMTVSVIMYKRLGISNTDIALYTSWLYLPWVIKLFWSPLVDMIHTKRFWIITMELLLGAGLAGVAFTIPTPHFFQFTLAFFWLLAFSSATHDIAVDGFYMLGLSAHDQTFFVGIRSTFYRIAMLTGQGLIVILAGYFESATGLKNVSINVFSGPERAAHCQFKPDSLQHITTKAGDTLCFIMTDSLYISTQQPAGNSADSLIALARQWNRNHGFVPASSWESGIKVNQQDWWLKNAARLFSAWIEKNFGDDKHRNPNEKLKGNVGLAWISLSGKPTDDQNLVVNLSKASGNENFSLIEGNRLEFHDSNFGNPACLVFQLDPRLKKKSSASFVARSGNISLAWSICFILIATLFILFFLYHRFIVPYPDADKPSEKTAKSRGLKEFLEVFADFFRKKNIGLILAYLLLYRFGEAQLIKMSAPFLLDVREAGGLGLTTGDIGLVYGTIGMLALTIGGILGGVTAARKGLKFWIWWMITAMNLPILSHLYLSYFQPQSLFTISFFILIEQFGYGFGFTAYMLFMLYVSRGKHQTAHFAITTGFMALGMMLPGMMSGWLQELIGYRHFFIWVVLCTIPGFIVTAMLKIDPAFGKKTEPGA